MIIEIFSFQESEMFLCEAQSETLVVFDVDGVISVPVCPVFQYFHEAPMRSFVDSLSPVERDRLFGLVVTMEDFLLEADLPMRIQGLHSQKAKTIALTAIPSGSLGHIDNMTQWRRERLLEHRIDFAPSFENYEDIIFHQFISYLESYPTYHRGVIASNGGATCTSKGDVLIAFLQTVQYRPTRVLFFDDVMAHLHSVEHALKEWDQDIDFIGFRYRGSERAPPSDISVEDSVALVQSWATQYNIALG